MTTLPNARGPCVLVGWRRLRARRYARRAVAPHRPAPPRSLRRAPSSAGASTVRIQRRAPSSESHSPRFAQRRDQSNTDDELSRLRQSDTIAASTQTQTFTYDPYGNLTQRQIVGLDPVLTPVETTPNSNRLLPVNGHPYTYDAAGNQTADYNVMYAYDPFNMLREKDSGIYFSKSEFYIYTASDERIGVKYGNAIDTPAVWSIRDFSGNVLRQYEGYDQMPWMSWLWIEDYMYRDGQLLAGERVPEEGGRRHFHLDNLGSPRLVTSQDSKEMSEHDYEPFGLESNPLYQETAGGFDPEDPKRFTGHERDYAPPGDSPASTAYLDSLLSKTV